MNIAKGTLQVYFEDPFWIGVFEREENGTISVCKVTFGPEPKDYQVMEFIMHNYDKLCFSTAICADTVKDTSHVNPKRMQRIVKKQMMAHGVGTKSMQALKLQHEEGKLTKKQNHKKQKEAELERKFELKQKKRKEKHKGR